MTTVTEEFDRGLTTGEQSFIARVRAFAHDTLAPSAKGWEYARRSPLEALRQASRDGFALVELAQSSGGPGHSFSTKMRMMEELSRHDAAFAFALVQHHNALVRIAEHLPQDACASLLPRMLSGEWIGCTAMTEPSAGSDFSAIATRARKVDGGWRLTGEKGWITNAAVADVLLVYAQTDPAAGARGIACFVVRSSDEGFVRHPAYELHGAHAIGVGGFALQDCLVPDEMTLYPPGEGFKSAMQGVNRARVHVAAMNAGLLDESLAVAMRRGESRQAFGKPLLDFQGLRWKLVDVANRLEAMRLLAYRGARLIDAGADAQDAAAHAKKFANDHTHESVAACIQAMGAEGLRADHPLVRHLDAAKLLAYTDGTVEMMNERIGHLLRRRYAADPPVDVPSAPSA